ncbi:WD40/YVTN/BNR-like repeat-containing protein [Burkholderia cepacia]|uniref:WD40/YVTN/BNR-like repeat-containing protein n=1 Tax=Burkholderia cepacia TaxID=292 RepID=UPI002AB60772|nr:YCF48-related protein [Burkholderia cepacia]
MTFPFKWIGAAISSLVFAVAIVQAAPVAPVLVRPALQTKLASRSVLIDISRAGKRLVAVGERGIVITSDDNGESWHQSSVPVSVTLTAVRFVDEHHGWAVGHSGVVLHSDDGGLTWIKQLDGEQVSRLLMEDATRAGSASRGNTEDALRIARQFASDGPDKPFLNLCFTDDSHGFVVGAYGLIFRTIDGGRSWQPWLGHVENPKGLNLYSIQAEGDVLYLAGESGYFARSDDGGASFNRIATPRNASYFAMQVIPHGGVVLAGLGGSAFASSDQGNSWQKLESGGATSISALVLLDDGRLVLANQAGELAVRGNGLQRTEPLATIASRSVNGIVHAEGGRLVAVGFRGVGVFDEATHAAAALQGENK